MRRGTWAVVVVLSAFASGCTSCGGTPGTDGGALRRRGPSMPRWPERLRCRSLMETSPSTSAKPTPSSSKARLTSPATRSVLLGHILTQEGSGVPGLTVSILNHPEFGSTTSQADGLYALAVPAGRWTVDARARSFVPSPRWVVAAARDFSHVDDIVVLRRDEKATTISLATGGLHVATTQTDSDGARTTSVFLPAGRKASLQLPDGGTVDAATLTLRATETTVGHVLAQSQRTVQRGRSQLTRRLGRRTTRRSRRA